MFILKQFGILQNVSIMQRSIKLIILYYMHIVYIMESVITL